MTTPSDPPLLQGVEDPYLDSWADYLGGKWQKELPERAGTYAIATREGHHVGYRELYYVKGDVVDPLAISRPWMGFWWSVPLPSPPKDVPEYVT